MGCEPSFPAEPGFLAFGVLAGGGVDAFPAIIEGDAVGEELADFAEADGFLDGGGGMRVAGDFVDGTLFEHLAGAGVDALVEGGAIWADDAAAEGGFPGAGGGGPLIAEIGAAVAGEEADFEGA